MTSVPTKKNTMIASILLLAASAVMVVAAYFDVRDEHITVPTMIFVAVAVLLIITAILSFKGRYPRFILLSIPLTIVALGLCGFIEPFVWAGNRILFILIPTLLIGIALLCLWATNTAKYFSYRNYLLEGARLTDGGIVKTKFYRPITKKIKIDGGVYSGEVVKIGNDYIRHGCGLFECADYVYIGEWANNVRDGAGSECHDGVVYEGVWKNGVKNGWFQVEKDGKKESGLYVNDMADGEFFEVVPNDEDHNPVIMPKSGTPEAEWTALIVKQAEKFGIEYELTDDDEDFTTILLKVLTSDRLLSVLDRYSVTAPEPPESVEYGIALVCAKEDNFQRCMTMAIRGGKDGLGIVPEFFESDSFKVLKDFGLKTSGMFGGSVNWLYPCELFAEDSTFENIMVDQIKIIGIIDGFYQENVY